VEFVRKPPWVAHHEDWLYSLQCIAFFRFDEIGFRKHVAEALMTFALQIVEYRSNCQNP